MKAMIWGCSALQLYGKGERPAAGRGKGLREDTQLPNPKFASLVPRALLLLSVQEWPWAGAAMGAQLKGSPPQATQVAWHEGRRYFLGCQLEEVSANFRWRYMEKSDQSRVGEQPRRREQSVFVPVCFLVLSCVHHSIRFHFSGRRHKWPDFLFLIIKKA